MNEYTTNKQKYGLFTFTYDVTTEINIACFRNSKLVGECDSIESDVSAKIVRTDKFSLYTGIN